MQIERTPIEGVLVLTPARFGDNRGFFSESWNRRTLEGAGVSLPEFVQDNHSVSARAGTLRGLHYQAPPHAQGKLVRCGRGALLDVAVDARRGSATYGQHVIVELSAENGKQLWVPAGMLHGFVTLMDDTEIVYKCTDHYDRGRCCRSPPAEDSRRESSRLGWGHEQAFSRPLPHDELVQRQRRPATARLAAGLVRPGDGLAGAT